MATQDISSKVLFSHNDVFSDVINALLFEKKYIDENKLKDVIPESSYEDFDGNIRSMQRDLLKEYGEGTGNNYFAIALFGIGNQTSVDPTIPVRVMGYDYTVYKRQLDDYNNKKRSLRQFLKDAQSTGQKDLADEIQREIDKLGDFKLVPVKTIVLNFSSTRWNKAKSLKELVPEGNTEVIEQMQDYVVKVFDVRYLGEEVKNRLTSDFKDVVTVLSEGVIDKSHEFKQLKYPLDTLDMLYAYTKDEHYLNIRNQIVKKEMNGEVIKMGDFFDQVERNKTIETARAFYSETNNKSMAIQVIKCGLKISIDEAQQIFDSEVLNLALA